MLWLSALLAVCIVQLPLPPRPPTGSQGGMPRTQKGQVQGQGRQRLMFVPRQFETGASTLPHRPSAVKAMVPVRPLSRHYTRGYLGNDMDNDSVEQVHYIANRDSAYGKKMSGRLYYNGE